MVNYKICSKCKQNLSEDNFGKDLSKKSGKNCRCKKCIASYRNTNREILRIRNNEASKKLQKKYKKQNLEKENLEREEFIHSNLQECFLRDITLKKKDILKILNFCLERYI